VRAEKSCYRFNALRYISLSECECIRMCVSTRTHSHSCIARRVASISVAFKFRSCLLLLLLPLALSLASVLLTDWHSHVLLVLLLLLLLLFSRVVSFWPYIFCVFLMVALQMVMARLVGQKHLINLQQFSIWNCFSLFFSKCMRMYVCGCLAIDSTLEASQSPWPKPATICCCVVAFGWGWKLLMECWVIFYCIFKLQHIWPMTPLR